MGIEKVLRLFLATSQFLFPGIYIRHYFGKKGAQIQDLAMDVYILSKVIFAFSIIYHQYNYDNPWLLGLVIWFVFETLLYVPTLIFASDIIAKPGSYKRSILLLFFNYFEIVFAYAVIYTHGNYLNIPFEKWYDSIYFSFTTLSTIGYGDYYQVAGIGKFLVCSQALIFLAFVVLFINFFTSRIENKGYFEVDKSKDEPMS